MQIMPDTQKYLGITDPNDPAQSIYGGAKYLNEALGVEKTPEKALLYYHGGPDWRNSYGPESVAYVPGVTKHYKSITTPATPAAAPDDPFTAALKSSGQPEAAPEADPFSEALTTAQKAATPAMPAAPAASVPTIDPITGFPVDSQDPSKVTSGAPTAMAGASQGTIIPGNALAIPRTADEARALLAEKPGYTASNILPMRVKNGANGLADPSQGVEWDLGPLRGIGNAAIDLMEGPQTGTVTPAASQLLFGAMTGGALNPSLARGTGAAIADTAAYGNPLASLYARTPPAPNLLVSAPPSRAPVGANPLASTVPDTAPAYVPPGSNIPLKDRIIDLIAADDRLAQNKPAFVPPGAPQPPNPLQSPAPRTVPIASANPLNTLSPLSKETTQAGAATPVQTAPQSVGAAASRDMSPPSAIEMTPAQTQAYRSVAEGQKLNEPQPVGMDTNRYVPGVEPTVAHMEQSANTSREQKMLESAIPEDFKNVAREHNEQRQQYFNSVAGSDVDVNNAIEARSAQAEKDLSAAFGNKKATDATSVAATIQDILTTPRDSENTAVQTYIKPLLARLKNADGTLKTDPEQLYGLREDVARMQSKAAKAETPTLDHVNGQLQQIKSALDGAIEKGAPGYQQYLDNYSAASRPIDTMQVLQSHENKLYDTQGRMQLSRVQGMMKNIVDSRASPGLNPYKSIPDETMTRLWNLRDDLRRVAASEDLAKARGSDTAQNMMDLAKGAGRMGVTAAAHGLANVVAPVAGSIVLHKLTAAAGAVNEVRGRRKMEARAANMLRPDPSKYPPPNPLQ